jgi:hypothetical protein
VSRVRTISRGTPSSTSSFSMSPAASTKRVIREVSLRPPFW